MAVLELTGRPAPETPPHTNTSGSSVAAVLRRWPVGTSYPIIVDDVTELLSKPPLRYGHLAIDATGVGRPVVDMFVKAGLAVDLVPVVITAGRQAELSRRLLPCGQGHPRLKFA